MNVALQGAASFIAPLVDSSSRQGTGRSIIEVLSSPNNVSSQIADNEHDTRRREVITRTLEFIRQLHASCDASPDSFEQLDPFARQKAQKTVDALLDLLVLEGIYPSLTPSVGVPVARRLKTALKGGFTTRSLNEASGGGPPNQQLLSTILTSVMPMSMTGRGLASSIQERMSVDLIAAAGELAFSPAFDAQTRQHFAPVFKNLIASKSAMDLFPQLTALLHPSCPDWFRFAISSQLSLLPLRHGGVRQTIDFIAGSTSNSVDTVQGPSNHSLGPNVSVDALAKIAKLLTSVPSTMSPDIYIAALAPQLLELLDDPALDNRRIASYIVGFGFLSKRKLGSPGTAGWRLFAQPIIDALNPSIEDCPVEEDVLKTALDRLSSIVLLHANPGLTKRLVGPILLPLWGVQCYALDNRRNNWANEVHKILSTYMKISATESQLQLLIDSLLWEGPPLWTYVPGASGGIAIRPREDGGSSPPIMARIVISINTRIEQYSNLLRAAVMRDDQLCNIFTRASKRWLLGSPYASEKRRSEVLGEDSGNPMESLINAKLTQRLLEDYKDKIFSSIEGIIQLIEPIISAFVAEHRRFQEELIKGQQPSLVGLRGIARDEGMIGDEVESEEAASAALGLLSAILSSSERSFGDIDPESIDSIQDSLKYIAQIQTLRDNSLGMTASNILMLLQLHSGMHEVKSNRDVKLIDDMADQRNEHRKALHFLSDELIPVRAQGLSALTDLISKASPILNIQSTVTLLISMLQDEDEYIYLSAIKTLGLLASNHPKTVIKMLLESYVDPHEESTLDIRIKVGEALNKTIEHLGQLFTEETAKLVGESMIATASRRGVRPKTLHQRERAKKKAERARKEAEEAWDGEIPGEEDGASDEKMEANAYIAKILDGWADTGREEDIRIRTSALSIMSTAIETNIAGVGASITSATIDCGLAILKLEKDDDRAILRRAAVMVILSVIKSLDTAEERGQQLGFGFAGENLAEVVTVLRYVRVTDTDDVVIGHIRALIESLEAWQQKSILGMARSQDSNSDIGFSLRGLRVGGHGKSIGITELD